MIDNSPADSATYARTRPAKMQVSTALGVILLLISGLGVRFPRGAQTGSDQRKRFCIVITRLNWRVEAVAPRQGREPGVTCENSSAQAVELLAQRSYIV